MTVFIAPTIMSLAGSPIRDGSVQGHDLSKMLIRGRSSPRKSFAYFGINANPDEGIMAVRYKQYKAHFQTEGT